MKRHRLKTDPAMWNAIRDGVKTAEFRRDDRGFDVGDYLILTCGTASDGAEQVRRISHIVRGPAFGIPHGYAMLSITPIPWSPGADCTPLSSIVNDPNSNRGIVDARSSGTRTHPL